MDDDDRLFSDRFATPSGVFSNRSPTQVVGQIPFCVWTIYGHGEQVWPESATTRGMVDEINKGWNKEMPGLGPFDSINCIVSKVVDPKSHAPGLSTFPDEMPTTTNFALHIPIMTKVVTENQRHRTLNRNTLDILGQAVMAGIREVDQAFGINYTTEDTSTPSLVLHDSFYVTFKIDATNFWKADIRKIYMKPNFGEWLRPSGQPTRRVVDGPHPFPIYGFFIIYAEGGSLPQECTLFGAQQALLKEYVSIESHEFPTFNEEEVKRYNLISVENRVAVEQKMGYVLGFLDIDGVVNPDMVAADWLRYRRDTDGVIQLLRRVIKSQEITHVEAARIIQALSYNYMLGMDSACNCPGDKVLTETDVLNSQDLTLLGPVRPEVLAVLDDDEFTELCELRNTQEGVLKLARTVLNAAEAAKAAAARAEGTGREEVTLAEVNQASADADASATEAERVLLEAETQIGTTTFRNNPLLVKTVGEAKAAATAARTDAKNAARVAVAAARRAATAASTGAATAVSLTRPRTPSNSPPPPSSRPQQQQTPSSGVSGGVTPPSLRGGGGGSAKKHSRKRARSRTQKQKRYISRNNKQIKKYAKRHTMRNRRRNTRYKYSSL